MATVAMRGYTIITPEDPVKVLISCWGLKDNTNLSALYGTMHLVWPGRESGVFTSVTR